MCCIPNLQGGPFPFEGVTPIFSIGHSSLASLEPRLLCPVCLSVCRRLSGCPGIAHPPGSELRFGFAPGFPWHCTPARVRASLRLSSWTRRPPPPSPLSVALTRLGERVPKRARSSARHEGANPTCLAAALGRACARGRLQHRSTMCCNRARRVSFPRMRRRREHILVHHALRGLG